MKKQWWYDVERASRMTLAGEQLAKYGFPYRLRLDDMSMGSHKKALIDKVQVLDFQTICKSEVEWSLSISDACGRLRAKQESSVLVDILTCDLHRPVAWVRPKKQLQQFYIRKRRFKFDIVQSWSDEQDAEDQAQKVDRYPWRASLIHQPNNCVTGSRPLTRCATGATSNHWRIEREEIHLLCDLIPRYAGA